MRSSLFTLIFLACSSLSFGQSDTSDLVLSTDSVVLVSTMDSILFGGGHFRSYSMGFQVSDTVAFGGFIAEFADTTGKAFYKQTYTVNDLVSDSLIDSLWNVSLNFGRFSNTTLYSVSLTLLNFAGVSQSVIEKMY